MTIIREVSVFEAKNRLSSLLEEAEKGSEIVITRRGKPVAKLVPLTARRDRSTAEAAARRILERGRGRSLGGLKIKDLIEEGRM